MTILAYIIVIVISQFMLTIGVMITTLLGFLLAWLPDRVRAPLLGFIGGVAGTVLAVLVARLIFSWLAGPDSFGLGPFLAATIPLSIPIMNDYKKYKQLRQIQSEMSGEVAEYAAPTTAGMGAMPMGAVIGIVLSAALFL